DVHDVAAFVDVAVLPVALQRFAGLGMVTRREARADPDYPALERLLPDELVERAVQHEPHALLPRRELERPRERRAVAEGVRTDDPAAVVHRHGGEVARALRVRLARVLGCDRAGPYVGSV